MLGRATEVPSELSYKALVGELSRNGWLLSLRDRARVSEQGLAIQEQVIKAADVVYGTVQCTRLEHCAWLSGTEHGQVLLKLESAQVTGSFKTRGAAHKAWSLGLTEIQQGVVTCSTGNHALAVLHAFRRLGELKGQEWAQKPLIYLPTTVSQAKRNKLASLGASLQFFGADAADTEHHARSRAQSLGQVYISPYNDVQVAGGQGTIALELLAMLTPQEMQVVYIPVGGGGLISGIASILKAASPRVEVVGCQPAASHVMQQCVAAGAVIQAESLPTLSDGTAGGVEQGAITLQPCIELVDRWVLVQEEDIARAMLAIKAHDHIQLEGAAAMAVAACIQDASRRDRKSAVVICCGGNVSDATFQHAQRLVP